MHLALTKIRHAPVVIFVLMKVAPQRPRVRLENMEIELDKILKLRHAHTHALQEHTACQVKLIFLLHVLLVLQGHIAMEMAPSFCVLSEDMEDQIPQNKQICLSRVHIFVGQENLGFSREKYRLTMHALNA